MAVSQWFDRVTWQQPSRTRAAAALLVISTFVPGQQPTHWLQAKEFRPTEIFVQAQVGRPLLINGSAAGAKDARRKAQAVTVIQQSVAIQFPVNRILDPTPPTYNASVDIARIRQAQAFAPPGTFARPQIAAPLIVNGSAAMSADVFSGFDTFGWPPEPPLWTPNRIGSLPVILTAYVASTDARRASQAKNFGESESFVQAQRQTPLILNGTAAYLFANDVQRQQQAKVFGQPEVFDQAQRISAQISNGTAAGWNSIPLPQARWFGGTEEFRQSLQLAPLALNLPVTNAAIEFRQPQAKWWFVAAEVFVAPWKAAPLLINGTAPIIPPEALVIVAAVDNVTITVNFDAQLTIIPTGP